MDIKEFIVILHKIAEKLDSGRVVFEDVFGLDEYDTTQSIYDRSNLSIARLSSRFFEKLENEGMAKILTDSYSVPLGRNYKRKDCRVEEQDIDMNLPVKDILKQVRALYFPDYRKTIVIKEKR